MNRKEALEALDELTQSNVFRTKQYPILEALINHHFDMVERVEKDKQAQKYMYETGVKEGREKLQSELCELLGTIKATEAL